MHELHLAQDILLKLKQKAKTRITYAMITLGQARYTHLEELKELLADIAKGTVVEGAEIEFELVPLKAACAACGQEFNPGTRQLNCAACGSADIQVVAGNELEVKEIR